MKSVLNALKAWKRVDASQLMKRNVRYEFNSRRSINMKRENLFLLVPTIIVIAFFGFQFLTQSQVNYDELANCLTEKGITMYGTDWCSACMRQKELFGNSFEHVDYSNCDYEKAECSAAGIRKYPTWVINGIRYEGVKSIEELSSMSGCNLE
jgi:glutaredoxin